MDSRSEVVTDPTTQTAHNLSRNAVGALAVPMDVLSALRTACLVPVVILDESAQADDLATALVAGGLPIAEVALRTAAALDSIRVMSARRDVTRMESSAAAVRRATSAMG